MSDVIPVILKLPVALPAVPDEPGFSVLSRNTAANASQSTAEFCSATGLSKAGVCAGESNNLRSIAELTGSSVQELIQVSPVNEDRKYTRLNGHRFLTRSIRKNDISICPACWVEDVSGSSSRTDQCALRWQWLPRFATSCVKHGITLCELPYEDYTTCYDHVLRAGLEPSWMRSLDQRVQPVKPGEFEQKALSQVRDGKPVCDWLPDIQIDVLERWCLGLGAFVSSGTLRPDTAATEQRREMIDLGYAITGAGYGKLFDEIDKALGRHSIRLSMTWLHGWSLASNIPEERRAFREIMQDLARDQGEYCLTSRQYYATDEILAEASIKKIATTTGRTVKWVRKALVADRFLPLSPKRGEVAVKSHLKRCRRHIEVLTTSRDGIQSAAYLGIGVTMFDGLVADRMVTPVKTNVFKKPRFSAKTLDGLLERVTKLAVGKPDPEARADTIDLAHAAFVLRCPASRILRFLEARKLPGSYMVDASAGLGGLRITRQELLNALRRERRADMTLQEVKRRLALSSFEMRQVIAANLLLTERKRPNGFRTGAEFVSFDALESFLASYQTNKTAAAHLHLSWGEMHRRVNAAGLVPAAIGNGARIYDREAILKL